MSHCVITLVRQPDGLTRQACVVHSSLEPCTANREPADSTPGESSDANGRGRALALWRFRTHGQRDLLIHHGTLNGQQPHEPGPGCWCGPELVPGVPCGCNR